MGDLEGKTETRGVEERAFVLCSMVIAGSIALIENASLKTAAGISAAAGLGVLWIEGYSPLNMIQSVGESAASLYNSAKRVFYRK